MEISEKSHKPMIALEFIDEGLRGGNPVGRGRGGSNPGLYQRNKRNKQSTKTTEIKTEESWTWRGAGRMSNSVPFLS